MPSTRERVMGVRSSRSELRTRPGHAAFFDNFAACPICARNGITRPYSERDNSVWAIPHDLSYQCQGEHRFSQESSLWDAVPRG